jgi:hypothetical protein
MFFLGLPLYVEFILTNITNIIPPFDWLLLGTKL